MVGQYIKILKPPYRDSEKVKIGTYLKIIKLEDVSQVFHTSSIDGKYKDFWLKTRIQDEEFQLMTESFTPEQNNSSLQNLVIW